MTKSLKQKCIFVKGAKNAAIYDLVNEKIYALNDVGKSFVEDFVADPSCLGSKGIEYINKLEELGLVEKTNSSCNESIEQALSAINQQLDYVWLELTCRCNLRCIHCYGQFGCPKPDLPSTKIMNTENWKRVIREIKAAGCLSIQLIGGEPLCFSDFKEILIYAHDVGIEQIDIFTNGTLIDDSFIKIIKETNASVRISLYGHDAHTHETITGIKGSFLKTQSALKLLKENEIPTTIAVVVMKANQSHIEDIKKYIESLGHKYSGYDTIRQVAGKVSNDNCVTDIEVLKPRYLLSADFYISERKYIHNLYQNNCWSGKLAIKDNGDVLPCIFARDIVIGNILIESLSTTLEKAIPYWGMSLDQVDGCKDCEYRYACHNCRPLAMGINENINCKEARCCYDPYDGVWRDIEECTKEKGGIALK